MNMKTLALATSIALVPATISLAQDDKKEALKKAKEEAKKKAIEAAKAKSEKKTEAAKDKAEAKAAEAKKADDATKAAAMEEEKKLHAKHTGLIERLEQIAANTPNSDELKGVVAKLKEKEAKRHALASGEG